MKKTISMLAIITVSICGSLWAPQFAKAMIKPGSQVLQEGQQSQGPGPSEFNIKVEKNDDKKQPKVIVTPPKGPPSSK